MQRTILNEEEINYDETFTPVTRLEVTGMFLAFVANPNLRVYHKDVKSAF